MSKFKVKFKIKFQVLVLVAIVTFICIEEATFSLNGSYDTRMDVMRSRADHLTHTDNGQGNQEFWQSVFDLYNENKITEDERSWIQLKPGMSRNFGKSRKSLLKRCTIKEEHLKAIQEKHSNIVENLPNELAPSTYKKGSRGIVIIGGGFFSWLSMLTIVQLRELGSELPIELVLPNQSDYNENLCEVELPKYNDKCMIISDVLGLNETALNLQKYQYKGIALLANSFQHVFLLDSDNFPVTNIDKYFDSPVYKDHNMVLWPDYWKRSIYPLYYDIAKIPVTINKQTRVGTLPLIDPIDLTQREASAATFHDLDGAIPDFSTESGQLLVNKRTHGKMLLLALYYNILGPDAYYKLFSLGARGEGDKDTFPAAALATYSTFYQVKSYISSFNLELDNGEIKGTAMGQHDPQLDYELYNTEYEKLRNDPENQGKNLKQQTEILSNFYKEHFFKVEKVPIFSVHCHIWKIDPADYLNRKEIYDNGSNRLKKRMYNSFKYKNEDQEIDFELQRWKIANKLACEDRIPFTNFENTDMDRVCQFMKNTIDWLKGN
ncbi:uncharacterized protein J8A68_002387 [[Candida] subhashii]|uniref:Alpha-1,2-mannosyltransferase n=1 Tax=[Candida] subhashii TaxID=561895 RepID=A0A8J5QL03_9ASCO|nr:uncharacterized protein J8A68_002387 [[Candida] subhashii]KAG7664063.1 hypothetical protein J8A68_002387 [[Candida] subhashii]